MANKKSNEELTDQDFSSEEMEVYKPNANEEIDNTELEVDDRAYNLLEHIDLDWPSQSIAFKDNMLYLATNPNIRDKKIKASLIKINLEDTDFKNLSFKKSFIDQIINRIRLSEQIVCVSDNYISLYSEELILIKKIKGNYSYGLYADNTKIIASTHDGFLEIFDQNLELQSKFKIHSKSIECIVVYEDKIFTASSDGFVKILNFSGEIINQYDNEGVDVNCLDVFGDNLIFGDQNGIITKIEMPSGNIEKIQWHTSSIEVIKWKDSEIFASGSFEQLCLWDITLVEDWEYSKYLLFVHQGQKFYKDIVFVDNIVVTTTQDGISIFEPVSFGAAISEENENE